MGCAPDNPKRNTSGQRRHPDMAIYHLSMSALARKSGRSAVAAAAYRAGCVIDDMRTGEVHDYRRKRGVLHAELVLPGRGTAERAQFWNSIEAHHKRGDAVVAREIEVSLPADLSSDQRKELATAYASELADRYGVAADVALHAPSRKGDARNWHAHILLSACHVDAQGQLGKKVVELDPIHCQRHKLANAADAERERWAELCNVALEQAGRDARVDHRSLEAQGIDREPTRHLGPKAMGYERRTGGKSRRRLDIEAEIAERLRLTREAGELERQARALDQSILDLSGDLSAALAERDRLHAAQRGGDLLNEMFARRVEQEKERLAKVEQERQRQAGSLLDDLFKRHVEQVLRRVEQQGQDTPAPEPSDPADDFGPSM